jgi:hypothetical protein
LRSRWRADSVRGQTDAKLGRPSQPVTPAFFLASITPRKTPAYGIFFKPSTGCTGLCQWRQCLSFRSCIVSTFSSPHQAGAGFSMRKAGACLSPPRSSLRDLVILPAMIPALTRWAKLATLLPGLGHLMSRTPSGAGCSRVSCGSVQLGRREGRRQPSRWGRGPGWPQWKRSHRACGAESRGAWI